jgi:hypothetical protein
MIELIFLATALLVLGGWAIIVMASITIADIKTINLERSLRQHPHARKWRGVTKLRKKLQMDEAGSRISKKDIRFAQARFQNDDSIRFVEIIPQLEFPQTTRQFFAAYRMITLAPFIRVRATLDVRSSDAFWPTLTNKNLKTTKFEKLYTSGLVILTTFNLALILYTGYIAIVVGLPDYLLGYGVIFGLWLAWSITNHPLLVWRQKVAYLFLAPASFGYFVWRALAAPFAPLRRVDIRPLLRRVLS